MPMPASAQALRSIYPSRFPTSCWAKPIAKRLMPHRAVNVSCSSLNLTIPLSALGARAIIDPAMLRDRPRTLKARAGLGAASTATAIHRVTMMM